MSGLFLPFDPYFAGVGVLFLAAWGLTFFPVSSNGRGLFVLKSSSTGLSLALPKTSTFGANTLFTLMGGGIITINLLGLSPSFLTPTAHLAVTFTLALSSWVSCFLASLFSFFKESSTHLVPSGTPMGLMSFMVLIELVSQLIRPITLGVRLAANLTAGHLLLQLLSSMSLSVTVMSQLPLLVLELLVAVVQGYVFVLLLTLYLSEV